MNFLDVMGNAVEDETLRITDSPTYFIFKGDAATCANLWRGAKVNTESPVARPE